MIKESPAPWARRCGASWLTRLSAQDLGFWRFARRIPLWFAAHFFHERSQAVNRALQGVDALVEREFVVSQDCRHAYDGKVWRKIADFAPKTRA